MYVDKILLLNFQIFNTYISKSIQYIYINDIICNISNLKYCILNKEIFEILFDTGGNAGLTGLNRPQSERVNKTFQVMEGGLSLASE